MAPHDTAVGRLEAQVEILASAMDRLTGEVSAVRSKLDQAAGVAAALRWLGLGSLASFVALVASVSAYLHGAPK